MQGIKKKFICINLRSRPYQISSQPQIPSKPPQPKNQKFVIRIDYFKIVTQANITSSKHKIPQQYFHIKIYHPMSTSLQAQLQQQPTLNQDSQSASITPNRMFRQLANLIAQHPFVRGQAGDKARAVAGVSGNLGTIKPKMFTKVVNWMGKICEETLEFCEETFEISVRILKKYLELSSQSPNVLQMLACISLHLASKLNEKSIVAIESYMECCLNIFTKEQFQRKQIQVYQKIQHEIPTLTFFSALDFLNSEIVQNIPESQQQEIRKILKRLIVNADFLEIEPFTLVCNLVVQASYDRSQGQFNNEEFLSLLKIRKVQY